MRYDTIDFGTTMVALRKKTDNKGNLRSENGQDHPDVLRAKKGMSSKAICFVKKRIKS